VVSSVIGLDVCEPEVPVQVSPFPVTVHEEESSVFQETTVVAPERTRRGEAVMEPETAS
jgi:hypothetical protein